MRLNNIAKTARITSAIALILMGCDNGETDPRNTYENGVVIVNEGGFGSANGSLSFYHSPAGEVSQNIFRNSQGDFAGDVVQSLTIHEGKGYIVVNGDNKIEIVDATTFIGLSTLSNDMLDKPRYVEIIDDKAYISVWGPYEDGGYALIDSYVLVVDLNTKEIVTKIETDEGTEQLLSSAGYLFASNNNFGASKTVAVIDPLNNTLVDQIEVVSGPAGMVTDANGKVWVICTGDFAGDNGALVRISPSTLAVEETIELHVNPDSDLAITPDLSNLVYTVGTKVYKIPISATEAPDAPLFEATAVVTNYAMGIDPETSDIWIGDALNFTAEGKVYVYGADGVFKTSFTAGIGPTQFVYK